MDKKTIGVWLSRIQNMCIGILLLVMFVHFFVPKPENSDSYFQVAHADDDAVLKFATTIHPEAPEKLAQHWGPDDAKPTYVFLYASWCGYCKQVLPILADMQRKGEFGAMHFMPISLDENKVDLAQYMLDHKYDGVFPPAILDRSSFKTLPDVLAEKGSYFEGTIPFSIIFDGRGKLVAESRGVLNKERIVALINKSKE